MERLFRESAILTSLKCEHIIRLYEVIDDVAHIVMVMELAQGGELLDVIKARHALPEREACKVFSEIVAGVEYCHRKNVIHRDLKLENILMVNQTVKIADFGLSNTAILGRSELGTACGTPSYLAPEQINREAGQHIGAPADLWSMGVILYAMVAGFLPFQARSTPALFKKILNLEFTYPDYFSEGSADALVRRRRALTKALYVCRAARPDRPDADAGPGIAGDHLGGEEPPVVHDGAERPGRRQHAPGQRGRRQAGQGEGQREGRTGQGQQ